MVEGTYVPWYKIIKSKFSCHHRMILLNTCATQATQELRNLCVPLPTIVCPWVPPCDIFLRHAA